MDGSDIIDTSGHQIGALRTMMPLVYGSDLTITSDDYLKGAGNRDAGHYELAFDAILVGASICTASGFTLGGGDTCAIIVRSWDSETSTSYSDYTAMTLTSADNGNYGETVTGLTQSYSAGTRISFYLDITNVTAPSIPYPQGILYFISKVV